MEVGIRELKARLSHFVKAAHGGERVIVTDRGVPVAVLSPPPAAPQYSAAIAALINAGRATAPSRSDRPVVTAFAASRSVADILNDDRDED